MGLFLDRVAIVTGGGTGIGRVIATELAWLGATVVIASRNSDACRKAADEMNERLRCCGRRQQEVVEEEEEEERRKRQGKRAIRRGRVIAGPSMSLRKPQEIEDLVGYVVKNFGRVDILVNNAGGDSSSCQPRIGSIVNITLGNRNGMPLMVHSGAARSGVENMTSTLCTEWMESGVRINCVRPGIIYTDSGFSNYGEAADEYLKRILPSIPAKRLGTPEEVSSAVIWLLSEGASYVTGTVIAVDGGSGYTFLPLVEIPDQTQLPVYGTLPKRARL